MFRSIRSKILLLMISLMVVTILAIIGASRLNLEIEVKEVHLKKARDTLTSAKRIILNEYKELLIYEYYNIINKRNSMKEMGAVVISKILDNHRKSKDGTMSREESQRVIKEWIKVFRYGSQNQQYFFIFTDDLNGIVHPLQQMMGKPWAKFRDAQSLDFFRQILDRTRNTPKGIWSVFKWPRLYDGQWVQQMGYFYYYKQWNWLIGTSVPLEDIQQSSDAKLKRILVKLQNIFSKIESSESKYVFVFNKQGQLLVHPDLPTTSSLADFTDQLTGNSLLKLFIDAARKPHHFVEHVSQQGNHSPVRHEITYVDRLKNAGWYVGISISKDAISKSDNPLIQRQILIILVIFLAAVFVASLLSKKISNPLTTLTNYAQTLMEENSVSKSNQTIAKFRSRHPSDEVGQLAEAFILMEEKVEKYILENETYRKKLIELVMTRTSELKDSNKQLHLKMLQHKRAAEELKESELKLQQEEARFETLYQLSQMINEKEETIVNFAVEQGIRLTGSQAGGIYKLDQNQSSMEIQTFIDLHTEQSHLNLPHGAMWLDEAGLLSTPVITGEPLIVNHLEDDMATVAGFPETCFPIRRILLIPIFDNDHVMAVAGVVNKATNYNDSDFRQLALLMNGMTRIVQRKQVELQLVEAKNLAETILIHKTEFINKTIYGFRSSIAAILNLTEQLLTHSLTQDQRRYGVLVRDLCLNQLILLDELDNLSEIEIDKIQISGQPFNIFRLMDAILKRYTLKLKRKEINLHLNFHEQIPHRLIGDVTHLEHILNNIITETVQFIETGEIIIHVQPPDAVFALSMPDDQYIQLMFKIEAVGKCLFDPEPELIMNSGKDIPDSRQIFENGLGLMISKLLAQLIGGTLWVNHNPNGVEVAIVIGFRETK